MYSKNVEIKIYTSAHNWVIFSKLEGGRCSCFSSNDGPDISFEIRKARWFTLKHKNIKLSFSARIPCSFVYFGEKIFLKGTCKPKKSIREKIIWYSECLFYFILFYLTLQYCIGFAIISKWICHRYTCVPHPEPSPLLPPHTIPLGRPSALAC